MNKSTRRYDIDWLRVIAIATLLVYHVSLVFQPWGKAGGTLQNEESYGLIWIPMALMNIWRIPLLFFVSGMGVYFAIARRDLKALLRERTTRIFIPLVFGCIFIVPIHVLIYQHYYGFEYTFHPRLGHLWFLANIFIYILLLGPVFYYLKRNAQGKAFNTVKKIMQYPLGLLPFTLPFMLEVELLNPDSFVAYSMTIHGLLVGFLAFIFGFTFSLMGNTFWQSVDRNKFIYLTIAVVLFIIRFKVYNLHGPYYLNAFESMNWIFAALGFAYKYLNHPSKALSYLSQAVYPIYIIHGMFLYAAAYFVLPLTLAVELKLILVVTLTFAGCFALYGIIRRVNFLRPLFGLKLKQPKSPKKNTFKEAA